MTPRCSAKQLAVLADARARLRLKFPPVTLEGVQEYLRARVRVTERGCWEWTLAAHPYGYGKAQVRGYAERRAHRLAYTAFVGPIPEGMHVLHTCDNPPCCNPAHLFLGTPLENVRDMDAKGRNSTRGMLACRRGHAYEPGSYDIHNNRGYKSRRCLVCRRLKEGKAAA